MSSTDATGRSSRPTTTSPFCSTLLAGPRSSKPVTSTPLVCSRPRRRASSLCSGRFWPAMPSHPRRTRPLRISSATTHFAVSIGTLKLIPCAPRMMAVLTPTTRPRESHSGPPLLPGLSATSLWMMPSMARPSRARIVRPRALTTPAETVELKPSGLPMATTSCPARSEVESPKAAWRGAGPAARRTARSVAWSTPTTWARELAPSVNPSSSSGAPDATCAFVSTYPSGVKTTPEPAPDGPRRERRAMLTTAGPTSSTTPITALEYASSTSASKPNGASIARNLRTRAAASTPRPAPPGASAARPGRELDDEARAARGLARGRDDAVVGLDDALDDREAEARAVVVALGREERIEDERQVLRLDAPAVVLEDDAHAAARGVDGRRDGHEAALVGRGLRRVGEQVHEDLHQVLAHAAHGDHVSAEAALEAHAGRRQHVLAERGRLIDDAVERHRARDAARGPRVAREVARQPQHAVRGLGDAAQALDVVGLLGRAGGAARDRVADQVVGVRDDRGGRVVELVDDAGGDLPEGRQLVGLDHALLEGAVGDAAARGGAPGELEGAREHGRAAIGEVPHRRVAAERVLARRHVERGAPPAPAQRRHVLVREPREEARGIDPRRRLGDALGEHAHDELLGPRARLRGDARAEGVPGRDRDQGREHRVDGRTVPLIEGEVERRGEEPVEPSGGHGVGDARA